MTDLQAAMTVISSLSDTTFKCPFCGHEYEGSDSEIAQHVVSYWGDDTHDFSCDSCGKDFLVEEIVRRSFQTSKPVEGFHND